MALGYLFPEKTEIYSVKKTAGESLLSPAIIGR
jgi:hypothetical protein